VNFGAIARGRKRLAQQARAEQRAANADVNNMANRRWAAFTRQVAGVQGCGDFAHPLRGLYELRRLFGLEQFCEILFPPYRVQNRTAFGEIDFFTRVEPRPLRFNPTAGRQFDQRIERF
jgi:hypothetical protein